MALAPEKEVELEILKEVASAQGSGVDLELESAEALESVLALESASTSELG